MKEGTYNTKFDIVKHKIPNLLSIITTPKSLFLNCTNKISAQNA